MLPAKKRKFSYQVVFKSTETVKKFLKCNESLDIDGYKISLKLFLDERDFK